MTFLYTRSCISSTFSRTFTPLSPPHAWRFARRYVKHVDDALAHRGRVLTCIAYANPTWQPLHGGQLRLHVKGGVTDVAPLHGRLVLFWSDNRCPHEVLPSHAERYAVSVWFSDAEAVQRAAAAERRAEREAASPTGPGVK